MGYYGGGWGAYVSVAERRRNAMQQMENLKKVGHPVSPVVIEGKKIAKTFWGKAWCDHLEKYCDAESRLPRGRTYVRNGSVVDLQINKGVVKAYVSGSSLYKVTVKVEPVQTAIWDALRRDCAGAISSLIELLQGRFSDGVMERICQPKTGLFPGGDDLKFGCNCPDWATMCKHVAAVLYGVGSRLDAQPELIFELRKVDAKDLIAQAAQGLSLTIHEPHADHILDDEDLSSLFGLDLDEAPKPKAKRRGRPKKA